jgi:hypothetical protein
MPRHPIGWPSQAEQLSRWTISVKTELRCSVVGRWRPSGGLRRRREH